MHSMDGNPKPLLDPLRSDRRVKGESASATCIVFQTKLKSSNTHHITRECGEAESKFIKSARDSAQHTPGPGSEFQLKHHRSVILSRLRLSWLASCGTLPPSKLIYQPMLCLFPLKSQSGGRNCSPSCWAGSQNAIKEVFSSAPSALPSSCFDEFLKY